MHPAAAVHQGPAAAVGQPSGSRKRCISSLQVTYHQEIHKPAPRLACQPLSSYPSTANANSNGLLGVEHGLDEDGYCHEAGIPVISRTNEEDDFYGPPSFVPTPTSVHHWEPPPQVTHLTAIDSSSLPHSVTQPPLYSAAPHSPLFGLEDGLRQRVNIEIENFRASLQKVMRDEFTSQRQQLHQNLSEHQNYPMKEETRDHSLDIDTCQSVETSIDSGVCVEATPTADTGATPPAGSIEEELSLALIQLQTLAAAISSNLQRAT